MMEEGEMVNLTTFGKKMKDQVKGKEKIHVDPSIKKESNCVFYKKKIHMKKDCSKFKIWLEKKGTQVYFVCYESNMVNVSHSTWWIDSGSKIYVSNTLQGMQNLRKPVGSEQYIYSGSKMSSHVEAIDTCSLVLSNSFILELEKTFYVPSFSKNFKACTFNFSDFGFNLSNKSKVIGYGTLFDGIFHIQLQNDVTYNYMHATAELKRYVVNEESSMLWHQRLGHISIERMKNWLMKGYLILWILSILRLVCIALRASKLTSLKRVQRGAQTMADLGFCFKGHHLNYLIINKIIFN